jgi:transposase
MLIECGFEGSPLTLEQFQARFPDDAACLKAMMLRDFGGTTFPCPRCGVTARFHAMTRRRAYACQACGHHIYPCAGTVLRRTRTPLSSWFFAMHLMASTHERIAAAELERRIGCTYKTALRMVRAFRKFSEEESMPALTPAPQRRRADQAGTEQRQG